MKKSIIYYTDNNLNWKVALKCRNIILQNSNNIPIISVSQKPIIHPKKFGTNLCVGLLGRSMLNMYIQILSGLKNTDADIVYLTEHDVLYTKEHFEFIPETRDFYYNSNLYFLNWLNRRKKKGMYFPSVHKRPALSQLICYRDILIDNIEKRIGLLSDGNSIQRGVFGTCEPGVCDNIAFINDKNNEIKGFECENKHILFENKYPNVDIRNGQNFTGFRRIKESLSTYDLEPWGVFSI